MRPGSDYRPEIDGLRAIAIVPVVLFHFGVPGVSGGFVGVDVFFVISGFLIGGILWGELRQTGHIRLGHFFLRRIRRLAPAYYAMALAALAVGWLILLPYEFREFGKELIAATVYLSNVYFYGRTGYFDVLGDERVLLHTWSLAVEEQFYLVLPVLLLMLARWPRLLPWLLAVLGAASLVACVIVTDLAHSAAFYLFPFRAWELLAGVLLAIAGHERGLTWRTHPALSWAGVALIALAVAVLEPGRQFPGVWAVLPVAGTVLVIANGRDANPVNRMLTSRPFLFFGAISYSLYLWHWPVVTLARYYTGGTMGVAVSLALIALSVGLAWLSLRFIENPVRRGTFRWPVLLGGYGLASAATLALAAMVYLGDGLIGRFPPHVQVHIAATRDFRQDWSRCRTPADGPLAGLEICPIGPEGEPRVLVWGDSHGRAFKEGLDRAAMDAGTPGLLIWRGGCPPLLGLTKEETAATRLEDAACAAQNAQIGRALGQIPSLERVLLVGRWTYYVEGGGVGRDAQNRIALAPAAGHGFADGATGSQPDLFAAALDGTLKAIGTAGLRAFVLQQPPEIFFYHSLEAARALAYGHSTAAALADGPAITARGDLDRRTARTEAILARAARQSGATLIETWDGFCSETACSALRDGRSLYFDNNHVTNATALSLVPAFRPVFGG